MTVNTVSKEPTKAEQRVAIAKDVLARLEAGRLSPLKSNYCNSKAGASKPPLERPDNELADWIGENCWVCAIGACFVSYMGLYDNVQKPGLLDWHEHGLCLTSTYLRGVLERCFDTQQLALIEFAFECWWDRDDPNYRRAVEFGLAAGDPKQRLRAIMQNIIDNEGEFKP